MTITTKFEPGDLVWYLGNYGIDCCRVEKVRVYEFSDRTKPVVAYCIYDDQGDQVWANENGLHSTLASLINDLQEQGDAIMEQDWYRKAREEQEKREREKREIREINSILAQDKANSEKIDVDSAAVVKGDGSLRPLSELRDDKDLGDMPI